MDSRRVKALTIAVGFGALTGLPLGLTGARVPAASAFLCSRWTCSQDGQLLEDWNDKRG